MDGAIKDTDHEWTLYSWWDSGAAFKNGKECDHDLVEEWSEPKEKVKMSGYINTEGFVRCMPSIHTPNELWTHVPKFDCEVEE